MSVNGSINSGCGDVANPCSSLGQVLNINTTSPGDTVWLDATGTEQTPFVYCAVSPWVLPIEIRGYNGRAKLVCHLRYLPDPFLSPVFQFYGAVLPYSIPVLLENLHFITGKVFGFNVSLTIKDCLFDHATVYLVSPAFLSSTLLPTFKDLDLGVGGHNTLISYDKLKMALVFCHDVTLTLKNTVFMRQPIRSRSSMADIHGLHDDINLLCPQVKLFIINATMNHRRIQIMAHHTIQVEITDTIFSGNVSKENKIGGLTVLSESRTVNITITNSQFINLRPTDILSMGTYRFDKIKTSPICIWLIEIPNISSSSFITISNVIFKSNIGAVTLGGKINKADIYRCHFYQNMGIFTGGAIYLNASEDSVIDIKESDFIGNIVGKISGYAMNSEFSHFRLTSDFFIREFYVENGAIIITYMTTIFGPLINSSSVAFVRGSGGAIFNVGGTLYIEGCKFINNTASRYGGSITSGRNAKVTINNSIFKSSPEMHSYEDGEIIFSEGELTISNTEIYMRYSISNASVIRHSGLQDNFKIPSVYIQCPDNFHITFSNSSDDPFKNGLKGNPVYKTAVYYCRACNNGYFFGKGYMNITSITFPIQFDTGILPYIDQTLTYQDFICHACPYGANCGNSLTSKVNFWGKNEGNNVYFYRCPAKMCCTHDQCTSFNQCSPNREGRLCGKCKNGYSEALFSSKCVSDESCTDSWLVTLIIVVGLIYAIFLLFQKDLKNYLLNGPLGVKSIIHMKNQLTALWKKTDEMADRSEEQKQEGQHDMEEPKHINDILVEDLEKKTDDKGNGNDIKMTNVPLQTDKNKTDNVENIIKIKPEGIVRTDFDEGGGFVVQLFYYFQDATLLHVETSYVTTDSGLSGTIKEILGGLFKFRLDLFYLADESCSFPGLTPSTKLIFKILFVPLVLGILTSIYFISKSSLCMKLRGKTEDNSEMSRTFFSQRASTGLMLGMMFSFQKLAMTTLALLRCVPIGNENALFIEGTVTCYSWWQWIVIAYTIICVIPFPLHLALGPALLNHGLISLGEYFLACLFPLPFIISWAIRLPRKSKQQKQSGGQVVLSYETMAVCGLVQGPYREFKLSGVFKSLCWAGVLLGRRLLLILTYTFVSENLNKLLIMFFICLFVLLHHSYVLPYKESRANLAGTISAAALLVVCCVNLVRAAFESAEYFPEGPNEGLMYTFDHIENSMLLWIPIAGVGFVILLLILRLILMGLELCIKMKENHTKVEPYNGSEKKHISS